MNILIHCPDISKNSGGVFQYTINLLNILKEDSTNFYWIFTKNKEVIKNIYGFNNMSLVKFNYDKLGSKKMLLIRILNLARSKYPKLRFFFPNYIDRIVSKYKINVIHSPYQEYVDTGGVPFITTMHDVQELHFPQFFSSSARADRAVNYKKAIELSNKVIVSYQHVKNDLLRFFDVKENNVDVILLDIQKGWHEKFNENEILPKEILNIPNEFILLPAATWEHKNHILLLTAIKELKDEGIIVNLICTGEKTEYYYSVLEKFILLNNLSDQVMFKGIVSDLELFSLYKNCIGVVIPTLYEAGSFPLYEAILLNIPVVCSNTTSLPETIENDKYIFSTSSTKELKIKIQDLYFNYDFRLENKIHLNILKDKLKSKTALKKILECYKIVIK